MSYATLKLQENIESNLMAVITGRRLAAGSASYNANVFQIYFPFGFVSDISISGTAYVKDSAIPTASGHWFYDSSAKIVYIHTAGVNPDSLITVISFQLFYATKAVNWNRDPLDSTTEEIYFEGSMNTTPIFKSSMSDVVLGSIPIQSSSLSFHDPDFTFGELLDGSSFSRSPINIYEWLSDLNSSNIGFVGRGVVSGISVKGHNVTVNFSERADVFNQTFGGTYLGLSVDFPNIDPNYTGKPIPVIFGRKHGIRCINIHYPDANDIFLVSQGSVFEGLSWQEMGCPVLASGSTGTQTKIDVSNPSAFRANRFDPLDPNFAACMGENGAYEVLFFTKSGSSKTLTAVATVTGISGDYILHTDIGTPRADGDQILIYPIMNVRVVQDGVTYKCFPFRDYSIDAGSFPGNNCIQFRGGFESGAGIPNPLGPNDTVYCTASGKRTLPKLNGIDFGYRHAVTGSFVDPVTIIYDILKTYVGLAENQVGTYNNEINAVSFQDLVTPNDTTNVIDNVAAARVPDSSDLDFPTYQDLLSKLLLSAMCRLYLDSNLQWTIARIGAMSGDIQNVLTQDDIITDNTQFSYDWNEIATDIVVNTDIRELPIEVSGPVSAPVPYYYSNPTSKHLNNVVSTKSFDALIMATGLGAATLAKNLALIFSQRRCQISLSGKLSLIEAKISDRMSLTSLRLPGFAFDGKTENTKQFVVVETDRGENSITVVGDDQIGIEQNGGLF